MVGRVRRGGYLIEWWMGDHTPKHVHVYRDGEQVAKISVPDMLVLTGTMDRKLRRIITELIQEGRL